MYEATRDGAHRAEQEPAPEREQEERRELELQQQQFSLESGRGELCEQSAYLPCVV